MAKYINNEKLTDDIIKEMIEKCGLELITSRQDDYIGETVKIDPIIRYDDRIIVSCRNLETVEMAKTVYNRFPMLGYFSKGAYEMGDEIVTLDDFFAQRLKIIDELDSLDQKLFDVYHETMCGIFGEEYERDARECFDKILEEENKQKEETANEKKETKEEKAAEMGE